MRHRPALLGTILLAAVAALALAGCGDDSSSSDASTSTPAVATTPAATTSATTAPAAATVEVALGSPEEFSLVPDPATVAPGAVTFVASNQGQLPHEVVVVPAPDGAAALAKPDGTADEAGSEGEVAELAPGEDGSFTVDLPAGTYALLCNLPGHFAGGMYADFTVG